MRTIHSRRVRINIAFTPAELRTLTRENTTRGRTQIAAGSRTVLGIGPGKLRTKSRTVFILRRGNLQHPLAWSIRSRGSSGYCDGLWAVCGRK